SRTRSASPAWSARSPRSPPPPAWPCTACPCWPPCCVGSCASGPRRGGEPQQMPWLATGASIAVLGVTVPLGDLRGAWLDPLVVLCVPVAVAVAVLRYRLWDLDRLVSRTVAYALLTLLLGLGYPAGVLGLGRLLPDSSTLAVAAATLAAAAAFSPLRRRVQDLVDRRFNPRRYDAARTVNAFSVRLRDQVDLDALHGELLGVVDQTMQP